jgi:hypothetical protein
MKVGCFGLLPLFRAALLREGGVRICPALHPGLPHLRLQGPGRLPYRGFPGIVYTLQQAVGIYSDPSFFTEGGFPFYISFHKDGSFKEVSLFMSYICSFLEGRSPFYVPEGGFPFYILPSIPERRVPFLYLP